LMMLLLVDFFSRLEFGYFEKIQFREVDTTRSR
jgi:hypothetical protein